MQPHQQRSTAPRAKALRRPTCPGLLRPPSAPGTPQSALRPPHSAFRGLPRFGVGGPHSALAPSHPSSRATRHPSLPRSAFTLIELLVVIAIIAILAGNFCQLQAQPIITVQPKDQFVNAGATVSLLVSTTSPTTPTYQWFFNGVALADATNRVLRLEKVQPVHSGDYSVKVSNEAGDAPSRMARLKVFVSAPHGFSSVSVAGDGSVSLGLSGSATATHAHRFEFFPIDASSDLQSWTSLGMVVATNASLDVLRFKDAEAGAFAQRFYRTPTNIFITHLPGKPTGPYAVGSLSRLLTDPSRTNTARRTNHQFMVTVWYPATPIAGRLPAPYVERQIAQAGYLAGTGAEAFFSHSQTNVPLAPTPLRFPIVLYTHAAVSGHRRENTDKAEELASRGFIVVGLDHRTTFRSVYPNGSVIDGVPETIEMLVQLPKLVQDRARDEQFVVDELIRWGTGDEIFAGRLDLERIGAFGWSFGGAAVGEFMRIDPRCKAGINMDGSFWNTNLLQKPLANPFMLIMADWEEPPGTDPNDDRRTVFNALAKDAYLVKISGSVHGSFADWIRIMPEATALSWWGPRTISIDRAHEIATALVVSFFNKHLLGEDDHLLDDVPPRFPEVKEFLRK